MLFVLTGRRKVWFDTFVEAFKPEWELHYRPSAETAKMNVALVCSPAERMVFRVTPSNLVHNTIYLTGLHLVTEKLPTKFALSRWKTHVFSAWSKALLKVRLPQPAAGDMRAVKLTDTLRRSPEAAHSGWEPKGIRDRGRCP